MRVVTVRDFRDRSSEMFRSEDVVLVTRDGKPAGFWMPWGKSELPLDVRREMSAVLAEHIRAQLKATGTTEEEVLADFAAERAASRRRR